MVHKTTLRAGERFRETRTGRNRIAAKRQIERKYDPRKPLMHPRSRCKRRRVLASLPVVSQTMFFRNGSKFALSKRAKASVWTRQSEAPSLTSDSDFRGRRCTGNRIHFAISCEHGSRRRRTRRRDGEHNAAWFVMAYIPFGGWIDGCCKSRDTSRRYNACGRLGYKTGKGRRRGRGEEEEEDGN